MTLTHPAIGYGVGLLLKRSPKLSRAQQRWMPWVSALGGFLPDIVRALHLIGLATWWQADRYSAWSHMLLLPLLFGTLFINAHARQSLFFPFWLGWLLHIPADMISHIPARMERYLWPLPVSPFGGLFNHEAWGVMGSLLLEGYAVLITVICLHIIVASRRENRRKNNAPAPS